MTAMQLDLGHVWSERDHSMLGWSADTVNSAATAITNITIKLIINTTISPLVCLILLYNDSRLAGLLPQTRCLVGAKK